ncbi:hypothetical protein FNF28_07504 [Cafeteria roenbergensis]|uniref:Uncharacterized protein n=1 Tax=Cafeteria roenbergensis TaxID=33653 RepID=A0A5A8C4J7_CAFRO|nr:hypothetical protein FNF28_07504 [Cafeteria roenbergensis]
MPRAGIGRHKYEREVRSSEVLDNGRGIAESPERGHAVPALSAAAHGDGMLSMARRSGLSTCGPSWWTRWAGTTSGASWTANGSASLLRTKARVEDLQSAAQVPAAAGFAAALLVAALAISGSGLVKLRVRRASLGVALGVFLGVLPAFATHSLGSPTMLVPTLEIFSIGHHCCTFIELPALCVMMVVVVVSLGFAETLSSDLVALAVGIVAPNVAIVIFLAHGHNGHGSCLTTFGNVAEIARRFDHWPHGCTSADCRESIIASLELTVYATWIASVVVASSCALAIMYGQATLVGDLHASVEAAKRQLDDMLTFERVTSLRAARSVEWGWSRVAGSELRRLRSSFAGVCRAERVKLRFRGVSSRPACGGLGSSIIRESSFVSGQLSLLRHVKLGKVEGARWSRQ